MLNLQIKPAAQFSVVVNKQVILQVYFVFNGRRTTTMAVSERKDLDNKKILIYFDKNFKEITG